MAMIALDPLGDRAYLAHFATERDAAGWAAAVRDRAWPGVVLDVVLAYQEVAVFADPDRVEPLGSGNPTPRGRTRRRLQAGTEARWVIPVLYDGADLEAVSHCLNLSKAT